MVTEDEIHQRLDELERLLWRRVFGRLRRVVAQDRLVPPASVDRR